MSPYSTRGEKFAPNFPPPPPHLSFNQNFNNILMIFSIGLVFTTSFNRENNANCIITSSGKWRNFIGVQKL